MLNFKSFGCKIGEDSLEACLKMAEKKRMEDAKMILKNNDKIVKRRMQFDDLQTKIKTENLPLEKLSLAQLRILCMYKKRDDDKVSVSKLKCSELLAIWLEWRNRPDNNVNISIPDGCSDINIDHCNHLVDNHGDEIMIVNNTGTKNVDENIGDEDVTMV